MFLKGNGLGGHCVETTADFHFFKIKIKYSVKYHTVVAGIKTRE